MRIIIGMGQGKIHPKGHTPGYLLPTTMLHLPQFYHLPIVFKF
jgi:hypothetical protein